MTAHLSPSNTKHLDFKGCVCYVPLSQAFEAASGSTRTFTHNIVGSIGRYQFDNIQRTVVTVGM